MSSPAPRLQDAPDDDLDNLFNYDASMDDAFRDLDQPGVSEERSGQQNKENTAGLGIDEEVKVAKKRQPAPKLDESRLLSAAGIPKLRKISKERLRFKGKGHEFSDVVRLLNMYQLWLDDLYPRAKFADGLAIIEKLGHTKRIQIMRKEWINEGKPKPTVEEEFEAPTPEEPVESVEDIQDKSQGGEPDGDTEMPQELSAPEHTAPEDSASPSRQYNIPEEDDLEALLAEEEMSGGPAKDSPSGAGSMLERSKPLQGQDDEFADEMEAMEGLEDF
ncbi:uncharacterized protein K452DRAFT_265744 [Aplosporella prunicola CBS 121167]|uniref:Chromosome segregation in meiosis protein n=1 Tax=Aplosporella prunicola CBS 121167 TaxID=1176127 RepID=A0A6A6BLX9_9PEZI|nr:uncharacterized protein K452DRAFT_265744 [Aplosporella prunicola CBS 121167]KAF2145112.1 hypothetical protein K452DRAFT_265744 [Aplosporella prunicola CBS 121167]